MTVTRFAPGVTGDLHIGGLCNALYNWLEARHAGGTFWVRFDGGNNGAVCQQFRDNILHDLECFGLDVDGVWSFADHVGRIRDSFREWVLSCPAAYACRCSPDEVAARNSLDLARVDRPEKYPPVSYSVETIVGVTEAEERIRPDAAAASSFAVGEFLAGPRSPVTTQWLAQNVLDGSPAQWRPWSVGFQGPYASPWLCVHFLSPTRLKKLEIVFPTGLPERFTLEWSGTAGSGLVEHDQQGHWSTPENWDGDRHSMEFTAPVKCGAIREITLTLLAAPPWFMRPYHYDRHCASAPSNFRPDALKQAMADPGLGVIRLNVGGMHPTAAWFDAFPDLAWYSAHIDRQLGVTDVWRGRDLIPFAHLEATSAHCMDYAPSRRYHPLVVDRDNVKYSKHRGAPRALDLGEPAQILGRLAYYLGLAEDGAPKQARDLLSAWPSKHVRNEDASWSDEER